jgi:fused signal recognition particle receptor
MENISSLDDFVYGTSAIFILGGSLFLIPILIISFRFITGRKSKTKKSSNLGLSKPKSGFSQPLKRLFRKSDRLETLYDELEELLLSADVGVNGTTSLLDDLRNQKEVKTGEQAYQFLKNRVAEKLTPKENLDITNHKPYVIYLVGINGTGKTTTIGKLASKYLDQGLKVLIVAADTYRVAAVEQLKVWADRSGADFVGGQMKADPASVIFDGISAGVSRKVDVVLVDTAGRLHNNQGLMTELKKMTLMSEKVIQRKPDEIWLTLDATTGQNGLTQALVFHKSLELSGLVLTKFDGTAKGGVLLSIVDQTKLPIRYIGVGEKVEDLREFKADQFVEELFS